MKTRVSHIRMLPITSKTKRRTKANECCRPLSVLKTVRLMIFIRLPKFFLFTYMLKTKARPIPPKTQTIAGFCKNLLSGEFVPVPMASSACLFHIRFNSIEKE